MPFLGSFYGVITVLNNADLGSMDPRYSWATRSASPEGVELSPGRNDGHAIRVDAMENDEICRHMESIIYRKQTYYNQI